MEAIEPEDFTYDKIGEIYGISIEEERLLWESQYIHKYIYMPQICAKCNKGNINLVKFNSTCNPFKGGCMNYKCKARIFLRKYSIFQFFPKIPIQILMNILKGFIKGNNATQIIKTLKDKYNNANIGRRIVSKFLLFLRKCIAEYYKSLYDNENISMENQRTPFAIDESLFTSINNIPIWVVAIINTRNHNDIRCNITRTRNTPFMRNFIHKYIKPGIIIISDGWSSYNFLREPGSGYTHLVYSHGHGQWGRGINSTSHIESVWAYFKSTIKKIYHSILNKGFYFYLKETEFRYNTRNNTFKEKVALIREIIKFNYNDNNFIFNSILELNSL